MAERPRRRSPRRASSQLLPAVGTAPYPAEGSEAPLGRVLITGGGGFLGLRLAAMLHDRRLTSGIRLFDVRAPDAARVPPGAEFVQGDLRIVDDCRRAVAGVSTVFHIASYGMSGLEMLNVPLIYAVNVAGTEHLLAACRERGVRRLVYTSSYNAVFCGDALHGPAEADVAYAPDERHADHYSRTKGRAERLVLAANAPALATCALRAAGIYGDGEERHFPRIISYLERGLASFTIGPADALVEWVFVDNLAHAHVLAALRLAEAGAAAPCAGRAYAVSDQAPINNFEFLRPLYEGLGYSFPSMRLPLSVAIAIAFLLEALHWLLRPVCRFQPLLSRAEVYKCGVTHYFAPDAVRRDVGYRPLVPPADAMARTVAYYQKRHPPRPRPRLPAPLALLLLLLALVALVAVVPRLRCQVAPVT